MSNPNTGTIYLIHFDRPYKHAKHYLGFAENLEARIENHRKSKGARLIEVINEAGIGWNVVRTWEGVTRNVERHLKNRKNTTAFCPICNESADEIATNPIGDMEMLGKEV